MTATAATTPESPESPTPKPLPPVLGRLLKGTFWLALRTPLQAVFVLWSVPLIIGYVGDDANGAYNFAWGFGFLQFVLEFGMSSALQRQVADAWTRGDRRGVDRAVACGLVFYAGVAVVQAAALLGIAYLALPHTDYHGASYRLIVQLLWLQALTAPCFGLSTVVAAVLQAARRYEVIPRFELAVVCARFAILIAGIALKVNFFAIVVVQTIAQVALSLGPALRIVVRELGYLPRPGWASRADFRALATLSWYVFLIQLSVVLADRLDKTILGFMLRDPGPATTVYDVVSKPFLQIRQCGWMLSYMVMPAVASLAAARDEKALERIKYDGPRLLIGLLLPVALLAAIEARPFLLVWVGRYGEHAGLLRLFLVATLPLIISVHVQMAIGVGRVRPIALWAIGGSLVNLPLSCLLTAWIGMPGVIWGTVLTTLVSNLLGPGLYAFRVLHVRPSTFLARSLGAPLSGAVALIATTLAFGRLVPAAGASTLVANLAVGCLAYAAGYLVVPEGRDDVRTLGRKVGLGGDSAADDADGRR
ncbi:MAG TPA: lipopolysaccharide biosynthesis protein [Isosphaeraceae bacterium]|jgi:O-antigen/teichoic acid export membrane protein|nr:lipopolysaccharide biosynthesis protein [Isosphaeraceae bacterium]